MVCKFMILLHYYQWDLLDFYSGISEIHDFADKTRLWGFQNAGHSLGYASGGWLRYERGESSSLVNPVTNRQENCLHRVKQWQRGSEKVNFVVDTLK